ncbi:MAG: hypothetical protein IPL51_10110 [Candidatus Competibacteraceae bacterium]|nr:hypothetical protein [Candidatus Competibacteraceae bacterium]
MSASDTIYSIISLAKDEALGTVDAAKRLVAESVSVLNRYAPVYPKAEPTATEYGISGRFPFIADEKPPGFPGIREPKFPRDPVLQDLDMIDAAFSEDPPDIEVPGFDYTVPAALEPFAEPVPEIDGTVKLPEKPSLVFPERPVLVPVSVGGIAVEPMVVPPLDIERKPYDNPLTEDWRADFREGLGYLPNLQALAPALLERFAPGVMRAYSALVERINGILEGRATALTDAVDQRLYDGLRARVEAEREAGLRRVSDAADGSGWGLPGRAALAMRHQVESAAAKSLNAAALEVYTKRAERELQHLQFVMDLASKLHGAALQFVLQGVESDLASIKAAIAFADGASGFALRVYDLRQRDYEIDLRVIDADIKVFEGRLRAESAKGELTRIRLELEKLKADANRDLIAVYTAELQAADTRVRLYSAELGALREEQQAKKMPLELFEAKLRAHLSRVDTKKAEYAFIEAQLGADKAQLEGELSKLRAFEVKADIFKTRVGAQTARLEGQSRFNDQKLKEFGVKVDAQLKLVQTDEAVAKHALTTYEAMARVYATEAQQDLAETEFAHKKEIDLAKLDRDKLEFDYQRQFHNITLELNRLKTLSDALMSSARVHGDMANSALSALNSVVSLQETAQV